MNPIRHILALTDLSENSRAALHAAVELAEVAQAKVTLLHVINTQEPTFEVLFDTLVDTLTQRAEREVRSVCPPEDKTPVKVTPLVRKGHVVETILGVVKELKIDVCVAGTLGRSGGGRREIGTVAEHLVMKAQSDMMLVRPEHASMFKRIAVATDFSELSKEAFRRGVELAGRFGAQGIDLIHVYHLPDEYYLTGLTREEALSKMRDYALKHMRDFLAEVDAKGVAVEQVLEEGEEGNTLAAVARHRNTDLLVMGSHGRSAVGATLLGSVAAATMRECPASMWIETDEKFRRGFFQTIGRLMGLVDD